MSDVRYQISGGTMANALTIMNQHMAEADQHVTTTEKYNYLHNEWADLRSKPVLASNQWKSPVSTPASLPLTSNVIGDIKVVTNDGDSGGAIYLCKATTGTLTDQWIKIADIHWGAPPWASILNKPTLILADGTVSMTAPLSLVSTAPTNPIHAASKKYTEDTALIHAIIFG